MYIYYIDYQLSWSGRLLNRQLTDTFTTLTDVDEKRKKNMVWIQKMPSVHWHGFLFSSLHLRVQVFNTYIYINDNVHCRFPPDSSRSIGKQMYCHL